MTIWLLDHGADPNVRCDIDYSPLSYAVKYADLPTIDLLLRRGGDVRKGQLVHNAIYRETETLEVVKILIGKGAPFNSLMYQDHQASWDMFPFMRETPLHTALALKRDDVVQYLIRKGANVNIENYKGQTVMQCADEDTRRRIVQEIQIRSGLSASL
jgi:ankyrin repeat protein